MYFHQSLKTYHEISVVYFTLEKQPIVPENMHSDSNTMNKYAGEDLLSNSFTIMISVYKLSVFTILILCTMYSSLTARGCRWRCRWVCEPWPCRLTCGLEDCSWGKRSAAIDKPQLTSPFPDKFENYDLDGSGGITLEELAKAIRVEEHSRETLKGFQLADKDGDGQIDCSEFKAAPYLFEHQPSCPRTE